MKSRLLFTVLGFFSAVSAVAIDDVRLSITNAGGDFVLSWPGSATNWVLEQSVHLQPPVPWIRVSPSLYQANATSRYARVAALGGNRFYRLSHLDDVRLSITNIGRDFVLSWPAAATNWVLEQSVHLRPPVPWIRVSPSLYQTNATSRYAQVAALGDNRFYRLRNLGPPVPGLTGYWQLDEGTGSVSEDGSGSTTALSFTNAMWSIGRIGPGSLRFNGGALSAGGSRAWVSNANYRVLPPSGRTFSVSSWFSPDALTTGWRGIVGNDANGSNGWHVALYTQGLGSNCLVFAATGVGGSLSVTGRTLLLPGQWRQLTVTHDGNEGSIFLDSVLLARGAGSLPTHDGPIYFGGGVGNYDSFLGRLDEVRAYTNCLTQEQISLTGHWRFDENIGGFCADSSIQGRHASVTDPTAWVPGHFGSAIELSTGRVIIDNDDYAVSPASGGPFSVSLWLQPHVLPAGQSGLLSCGQGTNGGWQLALEVEASNQTWLRFGSTNAGGTLDVRAPLRLTNGVWTKLDLTYNGGIATVYINGRQAQATNGAIRGSRSPLVVGTAPGATNFNGVIDDLKIYNREREATEIGPRASTMWETVFINSTTNITLQGSGPVGKALTYSILGGLTPTNGTITNLAGSPVVTYRAGGRKGPDAFAYTVSDGEFTSPPAIVVVSVVKPHWLSPTGGTILPLDGSSPDHAWGAGAASALDAIWKTNNYYDCFLYAPGEYQTKGWKYQERSTANPGCKHIGSGSVGPDRTVLKLVDIWSAWNEDLIFTTLNGIDLCDNFEVHQMVLDCNAANLPKFSPGEPVWLRIPLATTARVDTVTLRWDDRTIAGNGTWRIGRAAEFSLCARRFATNTYVTNCTTLTSTGQVDVVTVGAEADELILQLDRRAAGVDFYGVAEFEVSGASVSLPTATIPGGGESRLDAQHSILSAVDGNQGTWWASGPQSPVQIVLPLAPGTAISQVNLAWNCKTITGIGRLGPAASYLIRARDQNSSQYYDVPFLSHGRTAAGAESITFGTAQSTNVILTDQLVILLTNKEAGVDYYSLRDVTLQNGSAPVTMRLPTALSTLDWVVTYGILQAFDHDPSTPWVCGTQGMVGAIRLTGNNLKFTHLKVIGFGTKAGRECFPMVLMSHIGRGPGEPALLGNVLVEDCLFTEPATNNTDGLTTLSVAETPPDHVTNAVVRRCTVSGVRSDFRYSHGISANHMENCVVEDCGIGVYFEPDAANVDDRGPYLIRSNRFINVDSGLFMLSHPGAQFDSITCLGNEIVLTGREGWGWAACDVCAPGPSGSITNVTALNNIVRYADWSPRPTRSEGGFSYTDIQHAVFGNNVIALGTTSALRVRLCPAGIIPPPDPLEDCDHPGPFPPGPTTYPSCLDALLPGYRRAWFNNWDLSGTRLEVRFWNNGADGPASQQQWPE